MDWSRAKSVLILAFLILNIILGYQLWLDVREQLSSNLDWTSLPEDTKKQMEMKLIQVQGKIPSETPALIERTFQFVDEEQNTNRVDLPAPVSSQLIFNEKELRKALKDEVPTIERYVFDPPTSPPTSPDGVFRLQYMLDNKWPMFEVSLELFYANQNIVAYRENKVVELESKEKADKEQKVLPATNALGILIEKFLPTGSVVKEIKLGYHGQVYNETLVTAPAWRIVLESGDIYFVNAISAEVYHPKGEQQKE
ncbi:two-component system regulatory protein YycI [Paenibacillus terrigena]|uniref:two-component system regulatory protein YycI n=1 Tax=Paenibacillus terrigena TaxID=369333 RepID=UPI00036A2183|nr:two-component system regulatory protein YycI [Paenibacillus terrigena]